MKPIPKDATVQVDEFEKELPAHRPALFTQPHEREQDVREECKFSRLCARRGCQHFCHDDGETGEEDIWENYFAY